MALRAAGKALRQAQGRRERHINVEQGAWSTEHGAWGRGQRVRATEIRASEGRGQKTEDRLNWECGVRNG